MKDLNNILALDASTGVLSLTLIKGSHYYQTNRDTGFRHSELIMPGVEALTSEAGLKPQDLDLICTALGPGSFTGLRVAMASAKGIAAATGVPHVSVPTLDILAYPHRVYPGPVLPLIDARKGRFYAALYLQGERLTDYLDIAPGDLQDLALSYKEAGPLLITGPEGNLFTESAALLEEQGLKVNFDPLPRRENGLALTVLGKAQFLQRGADPMDTGPLYLRKSEAEISLEERNKKG